MCVRNNNYITTCHVICMHQPLHAPRNRSNTFKHTHTLHAPDFSRTRMDHRQRNRATAIDTIIKPNTYGAYELTAKRTR